MLKEFTGKCNNEIAVYGYGMMLQKKSVDEFISLCNGGKTD